MSLKLRRHFGAETSRKINASQKREEKNLLMKILKPKHEARNISLFDVRFRKEREEIPHTSIDSDHTICSEARTSWQNEA